MGAPETEVLAARAITTLDPVAYVAAIYAPFREKLDAAKAEADATEFDINTTAGMETAKKFRALFRDEFRLAIESARAERKAPILEIGRLIDGKAKEITAEVTPYEKRFDDAIKAEDKRKADERIEKARIESARIKAHQACLNAIATLPKDYLSASVADVAAAIRDLESPEYLDQRDWEEYADQAKETVDTALSTLRVHLENAKAREELAAMRAQQEAEAAARRAEEAKAVAERKRVARIKERIHAIELAPTTSVGLGMKEIQKRIDAVAAEAADDFAEFQAEAGAAIEAALGNLNTLLEAARDAEELAQLRADKARREQEEKDAAARKVREEQEAKAAAERAEREAEAKRQAEARAAEEKRQREEAAARRREQEALAAAEERARAAAQVLLSALTGMLSIVDDSDGVAGYHLNDQVAAWAEFEEVSAARAAVAQATTGAQQ